MLTSGWFVHNFYVHFLAKHLVVYTDIEADGGSKKKRKSAN